MAGFWAREGRRFVNNCIWSWAGWRAAWATENTLRQWTIVHGASAVLALVLPISPTARLAIVALGFLLLAAELMNTALEEVVDMICDRPDPRAARAKDCASAAVALTALGGGAAWGLALIEAFG